MDVEQLLDRAPPWPRRVVCLTEETVETLYRLGAGDRVVGVSGYVVRPPEARRKPKVGAFTTVRVDRIQALEPDLVLGFSDLQAGIAGELGRRGIPVVLFNQRSVAEILQTVRLTGALVGLAGAGEALARELADHLRAVAAAARGLPRRPRVFFEEWHEPLIAGIRWVSELVELAGGQDVCAHLRDAAAARDRIVEPVAVAALDPEVVIASWCGRRAVPDRIRARPGWGRVRAVREDRLFEVPSALILQPGPAALTDGLDALAAIIAAVARGDPLPPPRPGRLRAAPVQ